MNRFLVEAGGVKGEIVIPSSKSLTLRAILFGALAKGKSVIHHYLKSPDTQAMIHACQCFGAHIDVFDDQLVIHGLDGKINPCEDVINAGNSGIVLRFCTAVGALSHTPVVITGDHSIRHQRPMQEIIQALEQLGVSVRSMRGDGYAPIIIQGPITATKTSLCGKDSQPVSALLIAAAFAKRPIEISVEDPGEKPWIDMTLTWFDRLGIPYTANGYENYEMLGNASYEGFEYTVPGDFSSAAFPIAAALVTGSQLVVQNVDMHDVQGDKELIHVFRRMGANIEFDERKKRLVVKPSKLLSCGHIDVNDYIDAITILAVVGCYAEGKTVITNASVARNKECNRIRCITEELRKMGAIIEETPDGLVVQKSPLVGATVDSHQDHRMAMALAVAGMGAKGSTNISPVACVSKTFPTFVEDFQQIGANLQVVS